MQELCTLTVAVTGGLGSASNRRGDIYEARPSEHPVPQWGIAVPVSIHLAPHETKERGWVGGWVGMY